MPINLASNPLSKIYLGSTEITKAYLGSVQIYPNVTPLLLDLYPNASGAYSLRQLSSSYTGAVVRVRRSSDNTEQDFNPTELTNGTLATFCGANNGFVTTWYDQSGNSLHTTQTTQTNQPKIYDSATGLITENGKPAIKFDGVNDSLQTTGFDTVVGDGSNVSIILVSKWITTGTTISSIQVLIDNAHTVLYGSSGFVFQDRPDLPNKPLTFGVLPTSATLNGVIANNTTGDGTFKIISGVKNASEQYLYIQGTLSSSSPNNQPTNFNSNLSIGKWVNGDRFFNGDMDEILVYDSALSDTERQGIENNINTYYTIY